MTVEEFVKELLKQDQSLIIVFRDEADMYEAPALMQCQNDSTTDFYNESGNIEKIKPNETFIRIW